MRGWNKRSLRLSIVGISMVLGVVAVIYMLFEGAPWYRWKAKKEVEQYLAKTYEQPMVVEQGTYSPAFGYGAYAHPEGRPKVSFAVWDHGGEWNDFYPENHWGDAMEQDLGERLKQHAFHPKAELLNIRFIPEDPERKPPFPDYRTVWGDVRVRIEDRGLEESERLKIRRTIHDLFEHSKRIRILFMEE